MPEAAPNKEFRFLLKGVTNILAHRALHCVFENVLFAQTRVCGLSGVPKNG